MYCVCLFSRGVELAAVDFPKSTDRVRGGMIFVGVGTVLMWKVGVEANFCRRVPRASIAFSISLMGTRFGVITNFWPLFRISTSCLCRRAEDRLMIDDGSCSFGT